MGGELSKREGVLFHWWPFGCQQSRLLAAVTSESGAWLHALPSASLGTLLDPPTLRVAVALRVGAEVCQPHRCRCGSSADGLGQHALTCRLSAGRHPRHTELNDVIRRALQTVGVPSLLEVLEPTGIDRGDGKRPDGVTIFPYAEGKSLVWDATCVNTYTAAHLPATATAAGAAARDAEEKKIRKYSGSIDFKSSRLLLKLVVPMARSRAALWGN